MPTDFESYRRPDGSLDLNALYLERYGRPDKMETIFFMEEIEMIFQIQSRQVASIAIAFAKVIDRR